MFETEAESYATRECCKTCNNINHFCKEKCECWTFAKKGAEFGYIKANEWHYLHENPNDLPKNREKVLLLVKLHDKWNRTEVLVGYRDFGDCLGEYCKDWGYFEPVKNRFYDFVDGEEVIAWKEIMYPDVKYYCCR